MKQFNHKFLKSYPNYPAYITTQNTRTNGYVLKVKYKHTMLDACPTNPNLNAHFLFE